MLRLRGGGHELGRLEHAARRARRPGPRDPRDVGRRLRHERDPARDVLPRRDPPEELPARARDPAARRHLRAVGLQRRPHDPLLQLGDVPAEPGGRRDRRQSTTRSSATSTIPATRTTTRTHERHRPAVPRALQRVPGLCSQILPDAGAAVRAGGRQHQRLHRGRPDRPGPDVPGPCGRSPTTSRSISRSDDERGERRATSGTSPPARTARSSTATRSTT